MTEQGEIKQEKEGMVDLRAGQQEREDFPGNGDALVTRQSPLDSMAGFITFKFSQALCLRADSLMSEMCSVPSIFMCSAIRPPKVYLPEIRAVVSWNEIVICNYSQVKASSHSLLSVMPSPESSILPSTAHRMVSNPEQRV